MLSNLVQGRQNRLRADHPPMVSMKRLYFDLLQSSMDVGSSAPTQRSVKKPPRVYRRPAGARRRRDKKYSCPPRRDGREGRRRPGSTRSEAVLYQEAQVIRVEVRRADMEDAPFLLQRDKLLLHRCSRDVRTSAMELQEVNGFDTKALQALGDASPDDDVCGHRSRRGTPLSEGRRTRLLGPSLHAQKSTGDQLRTAVVVGHIETVKAVAGIVGHGGCCGVAIQEAAIPLHIGHLPRPVTTRLISSLVRAVSDRGEWTR